ncbi:MAG: PhzF family phenazine biosynthesis protein [Bacteroidales bacterium]|nr:PhzF family phenazine biosynthesis protein [Bacteroidales bacterium]
MKETSYIVNAFVGKSSGFLGSPACVVLLHEKIPDVQMLALAAKNGLPETAFLLKEEFSDSDAPDRSYSSRKHSGRYSLRWFTPDIEMDLCGHATLASAYVVYEILGEKEAIFDTCEGEIKVARCPAERGSDSSGSGSGGSGDFMYVLDFPSRPAKPAKLPENIYNALNIKPKEVYLSRDYILLYDDEAQIRNIKIDRAEFDKINLDPGGIAVTSSEIYSGKKSICGGAKDCCDATFDFVSRFFTPQATILEDPVTGSAHCTLVPFWADRLGKSKLHAAQLSERGGELFCELKNGRVLIGGYASLAGGEI